MIMVYVKTVDFNQKINTFSAIVENLDFETLKKLVENERMDYYIEHEDSTIFSYNSTTQEYFDLR